jgi:Apg6 BARA domain
MKLDQSLTMASEEEVANAIGHTRSLLDVTDDDDDEEEDNEAIIDSTSAGAAIDFDCTKRQLRESGGFESLHCSITPPPTLPPVLVASVESSSLSIAELSEKQAQLLNEYQKLRHARKQIAQQSKQCETLVATLKQGWLAAQQHHDQEIHRCLSLQRQNESLQAITWQAQHWNVVASDAFYIDACGGGLATINGLRLGAMDGTAVRRSSTIVDSSGTTASLVTPQTTIPTKPSASTSRFFPFGASLTASSSSATTATAASTVTAPNHPITSTSTAGSSRTGAMVPWPEINAALGQVALLVSTLQQHLANSNELLVSGRGGSSSSGVAGESTKPLRTPSSTSSTTNSTAVAAAASSIWKYELVCRGSTSQIGLRKFPPSSMTYYNLYYSEQSPNATAAALQWLGVNSPSRQFNMAMTLLLDCVATLATCISDRDGAVQIPHAMSVRRVTIGGCSVTRFHNSSTNKAAAPEGPARALQQDQEDAETWTRTMKYLLTNLKHLMAYKAVGLWTTAPLPA